MLRFNLLAVLCAGLLVSCVSSETEGPAVSPGRQAQALSSTTLNWGGTTNTCLGCRASPTPFLCSNDVNNWAAGEKSFTDPTDPDDEVVGVSVAVYGRCISKDNTTSPQGATVTVLLNGKQVGLPYKSPEKKCTETGYTCDGPQTVTSTDPAVISSYVKGGSNILKISPSTGSAYCVSHTIITLTLKQGHIQVTPLTLNFGKQKQGTSSDSQSVLVKNIGDGTLNVTSLGISSSYSLSEDGGFSLAPDAGKTLLVAFNPQAVNSLPGTLTFNSNDPDDAQETVTLSGTGTASALDLDNTSLTFGPQRMGVPSEPQTVTVRNVGGGSIQVNAPSIHSSFLVSPSGSFPLAKGEARQLSVRFNPLSEGPVPAGATLTLTTVESDPGASVTLSGTGVRPDLALTPGALSFGTQRVNTASGPQTVLVKNRGSGPIAINSLTIPSGFEVSWDGGTSLPADAGFNLAPDAGQTLVVKFKPVQEGLIPDAGLLLNSNDPDWSNTPIVLSGTGVRPQLRLTPAALTFGDQRVNIFSEPQTVKVENLGSGPISISSLSIPAGFEVTPADGGFNLPADGGSQMLSVRFRPTQVGVVDSDIALNSSDSDYLSTPIGVTGRGVKSIITLTPGTLSFGEIRVGNNSPSQQVTVRNDGSAVLNVTALSTSTHFSVNPDQPFSVPVNGETTLLVTFSPTATGDFASSALTLATDDPLRPTATVTLSGKGVQPTLGQLPSELLFNEQPVNTPSTAQTVTVTNTGYGTLSITELAAGQPFAVSPNEPFSLQKDQARQLSVTFLPTAGGTATGALSFKTNDPAKPEVGIALSGSGVNPRIQLNKESLDFGPQGVGTASSPQTVTVTNSGNGTLRVTSIGVATGQPYEVVPNTAFDLPGGASRELSVTFRPTALGSAPGTLTIRTNSSLTPVVTVALSGNGVAQLDMSPSGTLNFGNVKVGGNSEQNVTFTNNTTATIKLTSRSSVSTPFTVTNLDLSSPLTIPSNSSATFKVTFSPQVPGQASASLVVVSDAYNSPHTLNLVGVGVVPEAQLSLPDHPNETTLDFGDVRLTTSKVERVRLTNKGGAPLVINQPFVSPANSAFSYVGPSTQTIPAGGFLEFQVAFRPKEKITASATLSIPSDAVNAPSSLTLIGKGTYSEVKASPPAIFFGDVRVGDESNPVAVTISNQGSAPLTVQGLSVTGSFVTDSPALPDGGTPTLPLMVPSNKEATFNVRYKPTEAVTQNGSVTILTDANEGGGTQLPDGGIVGVGTVSVTLQGKGTIAGIELSPDAINFGKQRVTEISGVQPVIITNTGSAPLKIKEFIFSNGAFSIPWPAQAPAGQDKLPSAASPLVLGASESKAVPIVFAPMTLGSMTGRLHIDSNAAVSPAPLELSGEGVDGRLTSTPSVVAFEGVDVGSVGSQKPVTLTNSGGAALKILRVIQPSEPSFSISVPSSELVLEPNATRQLTVTFVPNRRGNLSGDVVFETDARINPSFNLALFGTGMAPAVSLDPKIPLNFGNANVGVTVTQSISVVNEGERDLYVSNIAFADSTPDGSGAAQDFKTEVTFPITVPPNKGSVTVPLKFSPRVVGQREAKAIFYTNDKPAEAVLLGVGTSPTLELSEPAINFANVLVGSPSTPRALTITNQGSGPLTLSAVRIGGLDATFFTMAPIETPLTLPAKGSAKVSLTFRPDAERSFQGELVLVSNDPQVPSASVTLSGVGVRQQIQLSESSLDFGQQLLNNTSGLRKVRVTNSSDSNVTLSGLAVEGEGFAQSRLTLPLVLAPGQGQDLGVTFTPLTETEVAGKLKISFSDPPLQLEVGLRGRGIRSVLAVTPGTLEFGAVRVGGARREQPFTLTNLSSETVILAAPEMTDRVGEPFVYDAAILSGRALEPNQSVIVPVSYQPLVETLSLAKLSFGTTTPPKPQAATLSLSGRATLRLLGVDTTSLDFGRVDVGDPVEPKVVTITNKSPQAQRVLVMLKSVEGTPFSVDAKNLADPIPAGGTATFTVSFTPEDSGSKDNEVQVWIDGDQTLTAAEVVIAVKGQGRDLTGSGSGCSCDTGAGAAGMLALLALVGLGSRRRRRA